MTSAPNTPPTLNVLIVDDNEDDALLVARRIRKGGYGVAFERVDTADAMRAALGERPWDIVVSDVNMPGFSAAGALAVYKEHGDDCPFIVVSGVIGEETAVSLLKDGAHDFILKNNMARLVPAIERELRDGEVRRARHVAEEARRISEERYALAARGANDGLWDWDLRAGSLYVSARWREMVGLGPSPAGDSGLEDGPEEWFDRIHPEDEGAVRAALDAHLAGASPHFAVEHRLRHRDGSWRWMLARGMAVRDAAGTPCRMAGSLTDITADREAARTLRKAKEDLENALAAKTRFLAAASHDLRQPFQSMRLYQHMLAERMGERSDDPVGQRMVDSLGDAMAAGEALLNALLDVSTLDAGVIPVNRKPFSALHAAATVTREFEQTAGARNVRLRVAGADDAIDSDPTLFGRMLRNLLSNAIRYTPEGGRVLVACRRRGPSLIVEVWDTGVGIPLDMQEAVFEDFVQLGNPERDRRQGLGLGLAIVRRTARLLGCTVGLRSQPGKGAMFSLTFPRVEVAAAPNVVRLSSRTAKRRDDLHVLVIEDDEMQLRALSLMLEVWGFTVTGASTAEDAFAALAASPHLPGLIISDFRLPGEFNGVQAVARICNEARQHIPAIIVTGDTAPERIKEATATGCRLIHKPYDPATLKGAIDAMAGDRAAARRADTAES